MTWEDTAAELRKKIIEKAKRTCEKKYGEPKPEKRKWESAFVDSYMSASYRVEIIVHVGSPVKGYVIVNHGTGRVLAMSNQDKVLRKWQIAPQF